MAIVNGCFHSVWDGGVDVSTPCKVDMKTKKVFDIVVADVAEVDNLEKEYVSFYGEEHDVEEYVDGYYYQDGLEGARPENRRELIGK